MIVLGANSEISQAFIEHCLIKGEKFPIIYLFSSDPELAKRFASHIQIKYCQNCKVLVLDITKKYDLEEFSGIESDLLFCATGYLGRNVNEALYDFDNTVSIIDINYARLVPVINFFAKKMEDKKTGTIVVLSSVAGDRGRQSNFIYGSAKAALSAYLSGLRNYLYHKNVHVMTVKPGYMDTKMTQDLTLNPRLTATPTQAAEYIYKSCKRKKNIIYVLPVWRFIMMIIKNIPESIFKRMKF